MLTSTTSGTGCISSNSKKQKEVLLLFCFRFRFSSCRTACPCHFYTAESSGSFSLERNLSLPAHPIQLPAHNHQRTAKRAMPLRIALFLPQLAAASSCLSFSKVLIFPPAAEALKAQLFSTLPKCSLLNAYKFAPNDPYALKKSG